MDLTIRCGMYAKGVLVEYYDFDLEGIERNLRWFEGAVYDEKADYVRIAVFKDEQKINSWRTPVDDLFQEFMENIIDQLIDERFVSEVEKHDSI